MKINRKKSVIILCIIMLFQVLSISSFAEANKISKNLLTNSSFEKNLEARSVYSLVGDYLLPEKTGTWTIDSNEKYHGKQSLKLKGTNAYSWQVLDTDSLKNVFSIYLKGSVEKQKVEIGFELLGFVDDGAVVVEGKKTIQIELSKEWKRYELGTSIAKRKQTLIPRHIFHVWLRPLTNNTLWADAAQLEKGKLFAGKYNPDRDNEYPYMSKLINNLKKKPRIYGPEELKISLPENGKKTGKLDIYINNIANIDRKNVPVWGGIPFPKGELFDEKTVFLYDENGKQIPIQKEVLARRHIDGSITSLLIDIQPSLKAKENRKYTLIYGEKESCDNNFLAKEDGKSIFINTGNMKTEINKNKFSFFSILEKDNDKISVIDKQAGFYAKDLAGTLFSSEWGKPDEIKIEKNGPLHCVLYVHGKMFSKDKKNKFLDYEVRIHAFAQKDYFIIDLTFENRILNANTPIQSIFAKFPVQYKSADTCTFGLTNGKSLDFSHNSIPVSLFQLHEYYGSGNYKMIIRHAGKTHRFDDCKANGNVICGNTQLFVQDFWQLNPKAFECSQESICLFFWPESYVRIADLPFGMSNTLRTVYAPFGKETRDLSVVEAPVYIQPDPKWVANSLVFGEKYLTGEETQKKYPGYHERLGYLYQALAKDRVMLDLTGAFDYGDIGAPYNWMNNETAVLAGLIKQYLRTYNPEIFERARILNNHLRDIDVCHADELARFMHHPTGGIHTSYMFTMGHYWITGMIGYYLLTGDKRTYNVIRDSGAEAMGRYHKKKYTGRERSRMLYHLAELYDLTHLKCFRVAYEKQCSFWNYMTDINHSYNIDYYSALGMMMIKKWYDCTGDAKFLKRLNLQWEWVLKNRLEDIPGYRVGGDRGNYFFTAMTQAARITGDKSYIKKFYDRFVWYLVSNHGFGPNSIRGAEFLAAADEFNIKNNSLMPDRLLGIDILTGKNNSFKFNLENNKKPSLLKIYRTRNMRIYRKKGYLKDIIKYQLKSEKGILSKSNSMSGKAYENDNIALENDFVGSLSLDCFQDGQAAISCTASKIELDMDNWFAFRRNEGTNYVKFTIKLPSDKNYIRLIVKNWFGFGKCIGAILTNQENNIIGHGRWVAPMGTFYSSNGQEFKNAKTVFIKFPIKYQGQCVSIIIYCPKWFYFRLLDIPGKKLLF